jgi:hypothetical protein
VQILSLQSQSLWHNDTVIYQSDWPCLADMLNHQLILQQQCSTLGDSKCFLSPPYHPEYDTPHCNPLILQPHNHFTSHNSIACRTAVSEQTGVSKLPPSPWHCHAELNPFYPPGLTTPVALLAWHRNFHKHFNIQPVHLTGAHHFAVTLLNAAVQMPPCLQDTILRLPSSPYSAALSVCATDATAAARLYSCISCAATFFCCC